MKKNLIPLTVITISFLLAACSVDPTILDTGGDIFIGDFSNGWTVEKGTLTSLFFLNRDHVDSTKGTGTLSGSEQGDSVGNGSGTYNYQLKGDFDNLKVRIIYLTNAEVFGGDNGPKQGLIYSGRYDTAARPLALRLVNTLNTGDSLVIRHG